MELFSTRLSSCGLLLLCTFWSVTDCTTPVPRATTTLPPVTTQPPTTKPPPEDVKDVTRVGQTVDSITIEFDHVPAISRYNISWYDGSKHKSEIIDVPMVYITRIKYTIENLASAQNYSMTLYSVEDGRQSPGYKFFGITAPENVDNFTKHDQNASSITLQWTKLDGLSYRLEVDKIDNITFTADDPSTYIVPNLESKTYYSFSLYTVFEDIESTGANLTAATAPSKAEGFEKITQNETSITLQWTKVADIMYKLKYDDKEEDFSDSELENPAQFIVTKLQSATNYTFSLVTIFDNITGEEVNISAFTAPQNAVNFTSVDQTETSVTLRWDPSPDTTEYILQPGDEYLNVNGSHEKTITNLTSATWYNFTLFAVFAGVQSSGSSEEAATAPKNAETIEPVTPTENSITIQWEPVPHITDYVLKFDHKEYHVTGSNKTFTGLESGTLHSYTLFAVFEGIRSSGVSGDAATVPPQVSTVTATERTLTTLILQWKRGRPDWKYSVDIDDRTEPVTTSGETISHTVDSLKEGTLYDFSIITVFHSLKSTPYNNSTLTTINCKSVSWSVTETSIRGRVNGLFTSASAYNGTEHHDSSGTGQEVHFTGLYPGATYDVKLFYDKLEQCDGKHPAQPITTKPPVLEATCKDWDAGYSIYIEWKSTRGIWDSMEIYINNAVHTVPNNGENYVIMPGFQPAKKYQASICSKSGEQRSKLHDFTCRTDARGVIAGAFFGVLIFIILACAVAFVLLRRPDIIRRNKPHLGGARTSVRRSKGVPLEKFPAHFNTLSADENKGFSIEYEDLTLVGTDQTQKAATTPENRPKNRFINVLPYDRSRVKLTSSSPHNDYINASYMPGYNSDREFIAAQGPMPSTASDFWRMIWEQNVNGIVMVTNCTEGGRIKCEQYWPDSGPRVCGDLAVFTTSVKKESDWTLREFSVKHRRTSEERTVKHFHFTAWPDHGVPQGTEVLIQFRELVRRHIQMEAGGAPTVVHCSAGVGRTGTIIALDTLLQQMEREKAVDINGFVYKMRLNRPHMVQTESQYVFLHQCVLDSLQTNTTHEEEPIYENEKDLIYANATALREYQNSVDKV